jgi:pimeloyl-ACP methyl ester carboxylesterase
MEEELKTIFDFQRSGLPYPPKEATKDVPVLLCLAGFPDSASVWNPLITHKELQSTHHVIAMGLPGFQNELPPDHKWGYTVQEIAQELHKIVQYCHRQHPYKQATIHLVGHDWGAHYCFYYVQNNSDRIDKYAALDIGLVYQLSDTTLPDFLRLMGYFLLFSFAFTVQTWMSKSLASLMIEWYPWDWVGPMAPNVRKGLAKLSANFRVSESNRIPLLASHSRKHQTSRKEL